MTRRSLVVSQAMTSALGKPTVPRWRKKIRRFYVRHLRDRASTAIGRQRIRLGWYAPSYLGLLRSSALRPTDRVRLLLVCLRVDWSIEHAHRAPEIVAVLRVLAERTARAGEVVVEAGCWRGGATVKLATACEALGYRLAVFDSFEGVEGHVPEDGEFDFSGQYRASAGEVESNLGRFGVTDRCTITPGRFEASMDPDTFTDPVRLALVDCDLGKGTEEVLRGVVPALSGDGVVLTQDFHIPEVRRVLEDAQLWSELGCRPPQVRHLGHQVASVTPVPTAR